MIKKLEEPKSLPMDGSAIIQFARELSLVTSKVNELIDFLQAKEVCQCNCHENIGNFSCYKCESKHDITDLYKQSEEASRGEDVGLNTIVGKCVDCGKKIRKPKPGMPIVHKCNPPQQEESKGEYPFQHDFEPDKNGKCWCNIPKESGYHTKPQLKEEFPRQSDELNKSIEEIAERYAVHPQTRQLLSYEIKKLLILKERVVWDESPKEDETTTDLEKRYETLSWPDLLKYISKEYVSKEKIKREANKLHSISPKYNLALKELLKSLGLGD